MRERPLIPLIRRGLALIVVVGILGVTAALATAFVTMAQLERKASLQRVYAAKAALLARSGLEDALARLGMGQDGAYGGEDWNGNGSLDGIEVGAEVYKPGVLNTDDCPVRYALRPSFFVKDPSNPALPPALSTVDGRQRGYSGRLSGDRARAGNVYALRVRPLNDRIYVNGGALDAQDRDPDGPTPAVTWPLDPNQEINPLSAGAGGDYRNTSMEGPNGFLVRLLNNLDDIVTGGATSNLGVQVVSNRPFGGYKRLDDLKAVLGQARYDQFKAYLTVQAWVDPKVVKPQPMDSRPWRWQDIDPAHRVGASATAIAGITTSPPPRTGNLFLNSGVLGLAGTQDDPWMQTVTQTAGNNVSSDVTTTRGGVDTERVINYLDTTAFSYPVKWERNFVYAWSQLRIGPPAMEPRAPVSLNTAPEAVLASALEGLKGTYLKVWEGDAGWDDNGWLGKGNDYFGSNWTAVSAVMTTSEWTPWYMTRADYGMSYKRPAQSIDLNGDGVVDAKDDIRSWYGPSDFDENSRATLIHTEDNPDPSGPFHQKDYGAQERGLVQSRPLGRLTETPRISRDQARAVAAQIRWRINRMGPLRTWAEFNAFVDRLPAWEDLDNNGVLDGTPHRTADGVASRSYQREDLNSNGRMDREIFPASPSSAAWPRPAWTNLGTSPLSAGQTAGLTFVQKDLIKAMANPNTDLNDFNPDANLWKEADKTDVAGLLRPVSPRRPGREWAADPGNAYVHTTEFCLDPPGDAEIVSAGRVTDAGGRLLALRQMRVLARVQNLYRDTTQADFMRDYLAGKPLADLIAPTYTAPAPSPAPYPLTGSPEIPPAGSGAATLGLKQALVSYPEPQTYCADARSWPLSPNRRGADADYDGQIGLGFIGPKPGPDETLRGALFDTLDAADTGDRAEVTDARGPWHRPLVRGPGPDTGNIFPDGVYSEKDRALMVPVGSSLLTPSVRYNQDAGELEILVSGGWKPNPAGVHFYLGFWVKPNWFPEASPRPHALLSLSRGSNPPLLVDNSSSSPPDIVQKRYENSYSTAIQDNTQNPDRTQNTPTRPLLLSFFPGGNNNERVTGAWYNIPSHTLLWGVPAAAGVGNYPGNNGLYASDDLNLRGVYEDPSPPHPIGRLEAHRWQHIAVTGTIPGDRGYLRMYLGRVTGAPGSSYGPDYGLGVYDTVLDDKHGFTGETNHIRFGETSAENNMNDVADATFANVRAGASFLTLADWDDDDPRPGRGAFASHYGFLSNALSPAALGRYYKESDASAATRAVFTGPSLPPGIRPLRAAWTEIPCDLWFDRNGDGWMDTLANDQFGSGGAPGPNGLRDVRIDLELWDDMGTPGVPGDDVLLASFSDAGGANTIPPLRTPGSRLYYKAVFVNEWDAATRAGSPLDVTPYLDDVTITYTAESGPEILLWEDGHDVD